mgnify:CR=1 FL=1
MIFLEKILLSNSATSWVSLCLKIIVNTIVIPIVAFGLDVNEANFWLLLVTVYSISLMLDFGLTQTTSRYYSYAAANKEMQINNNGALLNIDISKILYAAKNIYLIVALLGFLISIVIMYIVLQARIGTLRNPVDGALAMFYIAMASSLTLWGGGSVAYFQGTSKIYIYRNIDSMVSIVTIIVLCAAIRLGWSLSSISFVFLVAQAANVFVARLLLNKEINKKKLNCGAIIDAKEIFFSILNSSWKSGLGIATTYITIQSVGVIVSTFSSPEEGSFFLLSQRIIQAITSFGSVPFYVSLPLITTIYAEGGKISIIYNSTRTTIFNAYFLTAVALSIVGVCWLNAGEILPDHFKLQSIKFNYHYWLYMSLACLFERIGAMYLQIYTISNDIIWHKINAVTAFLMLIFMYIFFSAIGVAGLPVAILFAYLFYYVPISIIKSKIVLGAGVLRHVIDSTFYTTCAFLLFNLTLIFLWRT